MVGAGLERPAAIKLRYLIDKRAQARAVVKHEGVNRDPPLGSALDLPQRLLGRAHADAAKREGPLAVEPAARKIGGRLAVGYDDDVLVVAGMTVQQLTGEADTVLQVGERVAHVPARLGQILDFEFDRAGEETDDRKIIARVARADETLQRQRYLLGRGETALPAHRPAHIEQQDRGAGGGMVSVKDGEVLRRQLEGDAGA